jgi:protein-serine/threonine kinase
MAPEVVTRSPGYTKPADWWSFGIFTFDLLTGRSPFHSNRGKQETKERILRGKFHTPAFLTPAAQDMIRRLLRRPVERRLGSQGGAQEVCLFITRISIFIKLYFSKNSIKNRGGCHLAPV